MFARETVRERSVMAYAAAVCGQLRRGGRLSRHLRNSSNIRLRFSRAELSWRGVSVGGGKRRSAAGAGAVNSTALNKANASARAWLGAMLFGLLDTASLKAGAW
jgi:hypothetical protein